jgi:predicted nucleic acid binding AN1-type Zn finger protein
VIYQHIRIEFPFLVRHNIIYQPTTLDQTRRAFWIFIVFGSSSSSEIPPRAFSRRPSRLFFHSDKMPGRKPRCSFKDCKDAPQRIIGDCSFCNGHFCQKHRMLESHACSGLEDCKKESHARNADKLNSERTTVIKGV